MLGFDFAFGLTEPLDPSYGFYTAKEIEYKFTGQILPDGTRERTKTKTDLEFETCGTTLFNHNDKD